MGVFPQKENALTKLFGKKKVVIGVIHSLPLPGSPYYRGGSLEEVYDFAVQEGLLYASGGVDGLIVENAWDIPFAKPEHIGFETVATMAVMAERVRKQVSLPVGINCLANGVLQALAVAKATGAGWIRANQWVNAYIANEGYIEGPAPEAMRYRSRIGADDVCVFADVHVKHGSHAIVADRSLAEQTLDAEWFAADVLIATGNRTGDPTSLSEVSEIKANTQLPVLIGSGTNETNVAELLSVADGVIIASSLKKDGVWWNPVDKDRVSRFMELVEKIRG
ncbi:MAG: BtpA/SgcQ family protein [Firmicutes bacterium]|nr:BtpA/SgcQ family protein [Bacillota bacterium]